jgi:hypothetical protein
MRVDQSLAGVALFRLSPLVCPPSGISGERDNGDDSE